MAGAPATQRGRPDGGANALDRQAPRDRHLYRHARSIPLRDADDALEVNWCELTTTDDGGKVLYRNAFATRLALDGGNVAEAGRGRWKIENENNNTLKTKGYHFGHTTATANSTCHPCRPASSSWPS